MLKALRTTLALIAMTAAIAAPAYPQQSPKPQESPWAMRAPAAVPQGAPTLSAQQRAAEEAAEKGTPEQQALAHKVADTTAILKLIETRFNLPSLTKRDAAQMNMTEFFNFTNPPWMTPPTPPKPNTGDPCYLNKLP